MNPEPLGRSLAQHAFVAGLSDAQLAFLSGCTKNARFSAGEWLFREGGKADILFLLREGRVAVESAMPGRGAVKVETVGPGDVLGWSALFEPYRWHVDGRALEPTLVFAIDGQCLRGKLDAEPAFGYAFTRRLLYHVHKRLERARLQQLDVYKAGP
jgi:CRP/FNR family cyclic AMP-dependent transcriptional regulator